MCTRDMGMSMLNKGWKGQIYDVKYYIINDLYIQQNLKKC